VKTFLNEDSCAKSASCSQVGPGSSTLHIPMHCTVTPSTPLTFGSAHLQPVTGAASFTLNDTILRAWYTDSNVYAYRVQNLRLEDPYSVSPCDSGTSRWRRTTGVCSAPTTTINAATLATLTAALGTSTDVNPFVRDITLTGGSVCTDAADETIGAQIEVLTSGVTECFQHVHPNEDDVRDFSLWAIIHPGNVVAEANNRCVVGGGPRPPIPFFILDMPVVCSCPVEPSSVFWIVQLTDCGDMRPFIVSPYRGLPTHL
jgi:hypothetical protein